MTAIATALAVTLGLALRVTQDPGAAPRPPIGSLLNEANRAAAEARWEDAERIAAIALEASLAGGDPSLQASARGLLGQILVDRGRLDFRQGRYTDALARYQRSRAVAGDDSPVPGAEMGALLSNLGRYEEARAELSAALEDAAAAGREVDRIYALTALGTLASARGEYGEAVRRLSAAVDAARVLGDASSEASGLVLLAGVWSELSRDADAEDAIARALERLDPEKAQVQHAHALLTLAMARLDAGRASEAQEPLERARREMEETGHAAGVADARELQARVLDALGNPAAAESRWREAVGRREALGDPFGASLCLAALGESIEAQGRTLEAREPFERALALAESIGHPAASWRARAGLGRVAEKEGRSADALRRFEEAIRDVEGMRSRIGSASLRTRFLSEKLEVYRRAAALAARASELERAFRWTEAAKARTLLEIRSLPAEDGETGPAEPVRAAEADLALCELRYGEALRAGYDAGTRADLEKRLGAARAELEAVRLQVEARSPRSSALLGLREPPALREVQSILPPGAALLDYLVGSGGCAVWIVEREAARFVELDADEREIESLVAAIHRPIELLRAGRADLANLRFEAAAAEGLYGRLVAPIRSDLEGVGELWIVPDGPLWRLPFALLVTAREKRPIVPAVANAQYAGCRFLVEDFALACLPSAGLLLEEAPTIASGASLVVFDPEPRPGKHPPLRGAREEGESLCARIPAPCIQFDRDRAGEARFKSEVRLPARLHFATHAWLDDRRPAYSRLALAPEAPEDGWLHAFEIERLGLAGSSAVLSACETAGEPLRGEGLLGLSRAFLAAGARSVVATQWAIDDEASARLVERYYEALARGSSPTQALREAQIATMRRGARAGLSYVHPFFWAAFVHIGSPH